MRYDYYTGIKYSFSDQLDKLNDFEEDLNDLCRQYWGHKGYFIQEEGCSRARVLKLFIRKPKANRNNK